MSCPLTGIGYIFIVTCALLGDIILIKNKLATQFYVLLIYNGIYMNGTLNFKEVGIYFDLYFKFIRVGYEGRNMNLHKSVLLWWTKST